jgi:Icc protein
LIGHSPTNAQPIENMMPDPIHPRPLTFLHIGDLHITDGGLQNHLDLRRLVDEVNGHALNRIDFVYLPGDNADDGTPEQFRIVDGEMARLKLPWFAIPGDHDFKPKSLDSFYRGLKVRPLPFATVIAGCRCLFLDVVSQGTGGPDFRLGSSQMAWVREQLDQAGRDGENAVVFMHAYPADLGDEAVELSTMFDQGPVALVDTGHTHYNEVVNDGRTIYAATRSTGQIEEGAAGFSLVAVDRGVVSWRFKPLDSSWPFVLITSPADRRLMTGPDQVAGKTCDIRASALGAVPIAEAQFKIDDGGWHPMDGGAGGCFRASTVIPDQPFRLSVRVIDQNRQQNTDIIEVARSHAFSGKPTGSDAGSIGAWPERHLWERSWGRTEMAENGKPRAGSVSLIYFKAFAKE